VTNDNVYRTMPFRSAQ